MDGQGYGFAARRSRMRVDSTFRVLFTSLRYSSVFSSLMFPIVCIICKEYMLLLKYRYLPAETSNVKEGWYCANVL